MGNLSTDYQEGQGINRGEGARRRNAVEKGRGERKSLGPTVGLTAIRERRD